MSVLDETKTLGN